MKRMTRNRENILECLREGHPDCGLAPYTVSHIHYMLYFDISCRDKARQKTQKNQIRRTLNEMAAAGMVVMSREKNYESGDGLPFWEKRYQLADMVEENYFNQAVQDIERKINHAYNGFGGILFGKPDGKGLPAHEIKEMTVKVKQIIQRTHPDKTQGKEHHFKAMKKCLDKLRNMPVQA